MRGLSYQTNSLPWLRMIFVGVSVLEAVAGVGVVYKETVVQTGTSIIKPTPPPVSTPTPTVSPTSCVGRPCAITACPSRSTTSLLHYICDDKCLNDKTVTYTTTSYSFVTSALPCVPPVTPSPLGEHAEGGLEKRLKCVLGPTVTSTTHMACSDCHQFPTITTTTNVIKSTIYVTCPTIGPPPPISSTTTTRPAPTATPTPPPTTSTSSFTRAPPACWWWCYDPITSTRTRIDAPYTASPSGYANCGFVCT